MKYSLNNRRIISIVCSSVILATTTILGYEMENFGEIRIVPIAIWGWVSAFFAYAILSEAFFLILDRFRVRESHKRIERKKIFLLSVIVLVGLYCFWLLGVYPGLFNFDAPVQYSQFVSGKINEHHPVLHTLIVGWLINLFSNNSENISKGVFIYCVIQAILSAVSFSYAISYIVERMQSKMIFFISVLYFGLFPPIVLQVLSVTKDSYFLVFFILSITLLLELYQKPDYFFSKSWKIILICVSLVLMLVFRNNCIFAFPFLVVPGIIASQKKYKKSLSLILGGVLGVFVMYKTILVPNVISNKVSGVEMYSVPIQQMMRIYSSSSAKISEAQKEQIELLIEEDGRQYSPGIADFPKNYFDMEYYKNNRVEVNRLYYSLIRSNPKEAIEAFLALNYGFWYPGSGLTLYPNGEKGYWPVLSWPPAVMEPRISFIASFLDGINTKYYSNSNILIPLLLSPGSYFYLFILIFIYSLEKKKNGFIVIGVYTIAYWATFLLGPVALVRYAIYLYAMVPFYFQLFSNE